MSANLILQSRNDFFVVESSKLRVYLKSSFPRLSDAVLEDLVQDCYLETRQKVQQDGFVPNSHLPDGTPNWRVWFRFLLPKRALDHLRRAELVLFDSLVVDEQATEAVGEPPDEPLLELERRRRQGTIFSDILREFCQICETSGRLTMKEAYERKLRGESTLEIAAALNIPETNRNLLDRMLSDARDWILTRTRAKDVHQSVYETLWRRKPETGKAKRARISRRDEQLLADIRPASKPIDMPLLSTFEDVLRWVIDNTDALCPSRHRLQQSLRDPGADGFRDVRYHVQGYGCQICLAVCRKGKPAESG